MRPSVIVAVLVAALVTISAAARPNIVLIIADDLGFNDISFRGSNQIPTPNIDALAFSGVILDRHYVLPTCTPSRTAILTGQYPIRTGMQGYPLKAGEPRGLPLHFRTLPEHLSSAGYKTALVGKWHLGFHHANYTPTHRGFDHHLGYWNGYMSYFTHSVHMDSPNGLKEGRIGFDLHWDERPAWELRGRYATQLFTERAEQIIAEHDTAGRPLYLQIAHLATHAGLNGTQLEVPDQQDSDRRHAYIAGQQRRNLAGVIRELDKSVGRVVTALQQRGILNNTLIVLMADNGGETVGIHSNHASNWPLRGQKWTVYEGGVRGAALVWSPQLAKPGTIHQELVHATDWLPTFYHVAGGNVSDLGDIDGVSQWGSLTGTSGPPRSEVLVQIDDAGAIIQNSWKLVKGVQGPDQSLYLGDSGRGSEVPAYDAEAVVRSPAAVALSAAAPATWLPLTAASVLRVRGDAGRWVQSCLEATKETDKLDLRCQPYCLFNLRDDPCETTDVRAVAPERGAALLQRLAFWEALVVPQINQAVDMAADPRLYNMSWVSWLDEQPSTKPSAAATLPLPSLFAFVVTLVWQLATCSPLRLRVSRGITGPLLS